MLLAADLKRSFYFSYTYDLTQTLQHNVMPSGGPGTAASNDAYAWNTYMWRNVFPKMEPNEWIRPIVRGYIEQSSTPLSFLASARLSNVPIEISVFGKIIYVTLIARRSRHFAGTRFLKRGVNQRGYVANDVESEQIVQEMETTPLMPDSPSRFSSYVQYRGSIPAFWTQEAARGAVKPGIQIQRCDPFFSAAGLHFDMLMMRYGAPIVLLNLVKQKEKTPRESILLREYREMVAYLNQFVPSSHALVYKELDMARASKSGDGDVLSLLASFAEDALRRTGFFYSGHPLRDDPPPQLQSGAVRTNCVDCLDRTNTAQFMIAKHALAHQLHALGVIESPVLDLDCDAVTVFAEMFQDHGDMIALQYGGSHLVNTLATYRKSGGWTTQSRDAINTLKRFYSNSFTDVEKQAAINLFVGTFKPEEGKPTIWELPSDYFLHNEDPRKKRKLRRYDQWCSVAGSAASIMPPASPGATLPARQNKLDETQDPWDEIYETSALSSFDAIFDLQLAASTDVPRSAADRLNDSPFVVRGRGGGDAASRSSSALLDVPTAPPSAPPTARLVAEARYLRLLEINAGRSEKEYERYVQEFSSDANIPPAASYGAKEYMTLLQQSYLADYTVRKHDVDVFEAIVEPAKHLSLNRAPKAKYGIYADTVALKLI